MNCVWRKSDEATKAEMRFGNVCELAGDNGLPVKGKRVRKVGSEELEFEATY